MIAIQEQITFVKRFIEIRNLLQSGNINAGTYITYELLLIIIGVAK